MTDHDKRAWNSAGRQSRSPLAVATLRVWGGRICWTCSLLVSLLAQAAAPEWTSEKAVAIGHYFVASGLYVVLGHPLYVEGSEDVTRLLCEEMEGLTGGRFEWEPDPAAAADKMLAHIERKRDALGINKQKERKLFDMKSRRELL